MKKIISILFAVTLVFSTLLLAVSCGSDDSVPDGMKKLESDADLDYVMYIPEDWTQDLSRGAVSAYYAKGGSANLSMTAFTLEDYSKTLEEYTDEYIEGLKKTFSDFELKEGDPSEIIFGETASRQFRYTGSLSGDNYCFMQIITLRAGHMYIFTYTAIEESYESHLEEIQKVIDNFKFK